MPTTLHDLHCELIQAVPHNLDITTLADNPGRDREPRAGPRTAASGSVRHQSEPPVGRRSLPSPDPSAERQRRHKHVAFGSSSIVRPIEGSDIRKLRYSLEVAFALGSPRSGTDDGSPVENTHPFISTKKLGGAADTAVKLRDESAKPALLLHQAPSGKLALPTVTHAEVHCMALARGDFAADLKLASLAGEPVLFSVIQKIIAKNSKYQVVWHDSLGDDSDEESTGRITPPMLDFDPGPVLEPRIISLYDPLGQPQVVTRSVGWLWTQSFGGPSSNETCMPSGQEGSTPLKSAVTPISCQSPRGSTASAFYYSPSSRQQAQASVTEVNVTGTPDGSSRAATPTATQPARRPTSSRTGSALGASSRRKLSAGKARQVPKPATREKALREHKDSIPLTKARLRNKDTEMPAPRKTPRDSIAVARARAEMRKAKGAKGSVDRDGPSPVARPPTSGTAANAVGWASSSDLERAQPWPSRHVRYVDDQLEREERSGGDADSPTRPAESGDLTPTPVDLRDVRDGCCAGTSLNGSRIARKPVLVL